MSLVLPLLVKRLRNDLQEVDSELGLPVPEIPDAPPLPISITLNVSNVAAYSAPGAPITDHTFMIIIGEDYPYERPKVRWVSPIFHPNIMSPSEGGVVCVMDMDHWTPNSTLLTLIQSLINLLKNPNPHDPLRSDTCQSAADWFLRKE